MRTSAMARLGIMGGLLIALLVPLAMMQVLVSERAGRRDTAAAEVSGVWGGPQVLAGPVLSVPYRYAFTSQDGRPQRATAYAVFLPNVLQISGTVAPEVRYRGLFPVVVYSANLRITGRFAGLNLSSMRPIPEEVLWQDASLNLGITDPRGIGSRVELTWNGGPEPFVPGVHDTGLFATGIRARAHDLTGSAEATADFQLDIALNGTRELRFLPAGDETSLTLTSPWPHPSFVGPLPLRREIRSDGFTANWHVPYFGRGYPAVWTTAELNRSHLTEQRDASSFGMALVQPVDIYQQAERAVKYAALFIVMTFVIAFLWEIIHGVLVHPIQYLFIGFGMCIFYLLLLALSEHIGFDQAYTAAAGANIALLAWYWSWVLRGRGHGVVMAFALTALYGYLYLLLRLEDYALLAGSLGLFLMLALVMFLTRRVNWYDLRLGTSE